jgi:class 3 adenylate cyclase
VLPRISAADETAALRGDATISEVRRRHFAQSAALISKHAGYEIKTIGDSVMAVFRSVEAALDYACALQLDTGSSEPQLRAGIHIGPVEVADDDVFGTDVSLASRVVGAIAGAEIWLSTRAEEDIDRVGTYRGKGWQWQPHDVKLEGIGDARLWSLAREALPGGPAPGSHHAFIGGTVLEADLMLGHLHPPPGGTALPETEP